MDFYNEDFKRKNTKTDHVRYASGWKCRLHAVFRTATPIAICTIIALVGGAKWIFRDYAHMSKDEIIKQENKKIEMAVENIKEERLSAR